MAVSLKSPVSVQLVLGLQWGDEGKGKVVDLLGEQCDVVARFQGGHNAGHTVEFDNKKFILHLIPTGILREDIQCIIGNGVVVSPEALIRELATLEKQGVDVGGRLFISSNAHMVMPWHEAMDKASEKKKSGKKIGTTGRGIGPAYADKAWRSGLRMGDLLHKKELEVKLASSLKAKNEQLKHIYGLNPLKKKKVVSILEKCRKKVGPSIVDTTDLLHNMIKEGKKILLEGAQGALLDIDFGTYPYVTSSNTSSGGVSTGLGLSLRHVDRIIGIVKAYTTRVGNGPFPSELTGKTGKCLREKGAEFGATTGRPRRCGWFDAVVIRYSAMLNDVDVLAITKLDVLDEQETVKLCTGYQYKNEILKTFPTDPVVLKKLKPVYEEMPGWMTPIQDCRTWETLPDAAKNYLKRIEELTEKPIGMVSVGPDREETIWVDR